MPRYELNDEKLATYLTERIDGFVGPLVSSKFADGQSNPTFRIDAANASYVLRCKPPGNLLHGAHAVDREFRVLRALRESQVPVAKAIHLCEDESVIGNMFYIMEFVKGRIFWDPCLPELDNAARTRIYHEMNRVLAALHSVNIDEVGLQDFGKPGDYFARQTSTWTKQFRASETSNIPAMENLIDWLPANQPEDDGRISIVHGDYRLDNLMFDSQHETIIATLDWELSTLGHPFADLAYQCMLYHIPRGYGLPGLAGSDYAALGIPTELEYREMYCRRTGISTIPNWNYYLIFSMFRLAAICQGVLKRSIDGNASSKKAESYGAIVEPLANIAFKLTND
jgi:aminoglycoside phosphotransferase (APT) family kinase protein